MRHRWYPTMAGCRRQVRAIRRSPGRTGPDVCIKADTRDREHTRMGDALTERAWDGLPSARSGRRRLKAESILLARKSNATRGDVRHSNGGHKIGPWNVDQRHECMGMI
ncbi:hypothetical protein [Kibdelosporangium philippinense]|uniref:hypothetical protein n=1 Tax=Kibdelosporangium philippinense TaxID=211113 RepID=UPI00361FA55B